MIYENEDTQACIVSIPASFPVAPLCAPMAATAADDVLTVAEAREVSKKAFLWSLHPVGIWHLRSNGAQNQSKPRAAGIKCLKGFSGRGTDRT